MLTQTAKYAIQALIYLVEHRGNSYIQTREIAEMIQVPANYLGKTLQKLAHARILDSQKGLHGGFRMARAAERVTLYEILVSIEAIPRDLSDAEGDDIAGLPSAVYAKFAELSTMYNQFLKNTSLAQLLPTPAAAPVEAQPIEAEASA